MSIFKSKETMRNYLLSGRLLRCNCLVFKVKKGVLYFIDSTGSYKSSDSVQECIDRWFDSGNISKVKNKKELKELIEQQRIY